MVSTEFVQITVTITYNSYTYNNSYSLSNVYSENVLLVCTETLRLLKLNSNVNQFFAVPVKLKMYKFVIIELSQTLHLWPFLAMDWDHKKSASLSLSLSLCRARERARTHTHTIILSLKHTPRVQKTTSFSLRSL